MQYSLTITDKDRIIDLYADYIKYILFDFEEFFAELEGIYRGHNYYPLYQISCNILLNWQEEASNDAKSIIDKWIDSDASIENVLWSIAGSEDIPLDTLIMAGELQTELVRSTMSLFQFEYDLSHISNEISMKKDIDEIFSDFNDKTNQLKRKIESHYEDITITISDATPDNNIYQFLRYFVDIIFNLLRKHIDYIEKYFAMSEHDLIDHLTKVQFRGQLTAEDLTKSINNYELGQLNSLFSYSDYHTEPTEFNAIISRSKNEGSSIGHKKKIILKRNGSIYSSHFYHFMKKDGKDVLIFEYIDGNSAIIWSSADWDEVEKVIPNARLMPSYLLINGNEVKIDDIYKFPKLNDIIINGKNFSHHECQFKIIEGKKSIVFKYIDGKSAVNWNPEDWELVAKQIPDVRSFPAYFHINNQFLNNHIQKIPEAYKMPDISWTDVHKVYFDKIKEKSNQTIIKSYLTYADNNLIRNIINSQSKDETFFYNPKVEEMINDEYVKFIGKNKVNFSKEEVSYIHEMGHLIAALKTKKLFFHSMVVNKIMIYFNNQSRCLEAKEVKRIGNVCVCIGCAAYNKYDYLAYNRGSLISVPLYNKHKLKVYDKINKIKKIPKMINDGPFSSDFEREKQLRDGELDSVIKEINVIKEKHERFFKKNM